VGAKVVFGADVMELSRLIERIATYPVTGKERRISLFYSIFLLNSLYFFDCAVKDGSPYLVHRATVDAVYGGLRMFFARNERFFPCHRRMLAEARRLPDKPEDLAAKAEAFCAAPSPAARDAFVAVVKEYPGWNLDFGDHNLHLSTYVKAMEQSWVNSEDNAFEL